MGGSTRGIVAMGAREVIGVEGWPALIRNTWNIGDFTPWKEHDASQQALARLLRDLTAAARQPETLA